MPPPRKETSLASDAETIRSLLNGDLVAERPCVVLVSQLTLKLLGDVELHRQLEPQIFLRAAPRQVLEVSRATLDCRTETIGNQIAHEPDYVEQRALSARVGAYQKVEGAVEIDVHVPQAAEIQSLDSSNHEAVSG